MEMKYSIAKPLITKIPQTPFRETKITIPKSTKIKPYDK